MSFLSENGYGDPAARKREVHEAIEKLRYAPLRCAVEGVRRGHTFRRLVVGGRLYVYYIYIPPQGMETCGTLSIRAVKHSGAARPFAGVREASFEELRA
jgi:hypothetical protein